MRKEGFREVGRGQRGRDELKGMVVLSALVHVLAMGLVVLLVAYFPPRKPPAPPVYTVSLVDLEGPSGKGGSKGLKKGRPNRESRPRKGKEGTKELFLPKPKEEAREVKKVEALKKPEPKLVKRPEVKPEEPKKIALTAKEKKTEVEKKEEPRKVAQAEKEKRVAPVERIERKEEAAREARPEVRETRREERPAGREEASPAGREEKGGKEREGSSGGGVSAGAPLVISRGNGGDGGVYKGSLSPDGNFPFQSYLKRVRDKIEHNWSPVVGYLPPAGKRVVVAFRILKDGRISHPQVEKASGISFLDQSALRAVLESQPFPPLPSEFNEEFLGVHFGFEYVDQG
ncbi:MAG: cell envelope integrity protein TolA [Candidatus Tectomicrobia bacterium]|uniref:Cell envelope integrity protein TolA n=1 Tax=Tectimicrobiota bacterium TaxID=2528274 RepID=A0A932CPH7_UNCTE|nr:cell envelope integrity protein TolA [Candidatus Tectomicrobia bacterium]